MAADTPCRSCGKPIYYNYRGPVEGVCGKCTDRMRKGARGGNSRRILRMSFGRKGTVRDAGIALLVAIGIAASILARVPQRGWRSSLPASAFRRVLAAGCRVAIVPPG